VHDSARGVDQQLEIIDEAQNGAAVLGSKIARSHCCKPGPRIGLDEPTELLQGLLTG
jgi:hypothetical protein